MRRQYFKGTSSNHIPTPQQNLLGQFWFKTFLSILKSTTPYHIPNSKYSISGSTVIFSKYLSKNVPPPSGLYSLINDHHFFKKSSKKLHFLHKCHRGVKNFSREGKNRVIFKSSKHEKKRNLFYPGVRTYQLGFRRVILSTSFLPPTLPEKFFTPPIVWNIPKEGRTSFEFEFTNLELFTITL